MKNTQLEIQTRNDFIRKEYDIYYMLGTIVQTNGINALIHENDCYKEFLNKLTTFADFTKENDPYGQHDFGSFEVAGEKIYFKFDYYNKGKTMGADPYNEYYEPVMTVMLAEEY
jgi:hypothetical protein